MKNAELVRTLLELGAKNEICDAWSPSYKVRHSNLNSRIYLITKMQAMMEDKKEIVEMVIKAEVDSLASKMLLESSPKEAEAPMYRWKGKEQIAREENNKRTFFPIHLAAVQGDAARLEVLIKERLDFLTSEKGKEEKRKHILAVIDRNNGKGEEGREAETETNPLDIPSKEGECV